MEKTRRIPIPELLTLLNVGLYCYVLYLLAPAQDGSIFLRIYGLMIYYILLPFAGLTDMNMHTNVVFLLNVVLIFTTPIALILSHVDRKKISNLNVNIIFLANSFIFISNSLLLPLLLFFYFWVIAVIRFIY